MKCRRGGTGRRAGLKILWWQHRTGSIPVVGTAYTGSSALVNYRAGLFAIHGIERLTVIWKIDFAGMIYKYFEMVDILLKSICWIIMWKVVGMYDCGLRIIKVYDKISMKNC